MIKKEYKNMRKKNKQVQTKSKNRSANINRIKIINLKNKINL